MYNTGREKNGSDWRERESEMKEETVNGYVEERNEGRFEENE